MRKRNYYSINRLEFDLRSKMFTKRLKKILVAVIGCAYLKKTKTFIVEKY